MLQIVTGATGLSLSPRVVQQEGLKTRKLPRAIPVRNVDGTTNIGGSITHEVDLTLWFEGHQERATFEICDIGKVDVIIGFPWLQKHNPDIDWSTGKIKMTRCPRACGNHARIHKELKEWRTTERYELMQYLWEKEKDMDFTFWLQEKKKEEKKNPGTYWEQMEHPSNYENCDKYPFTPLNPKTGSIRVMEKEKKKLGAAELVPKEYHQYLKVFEQAASERMPVRKPWDHAIDMKPGFVLKKGKIIQLSPDEQQEVQSFLMDQLGKGYIRPSKSPQTSPVFFVPKKDKKKRMVHSV
jgi:hypothetical protein